ncbi:SLBB domain-containing protein [Candidatus Poribacteria bacterium]|nr:SLBB domain-containing protein [Candidatus Poribacteria bacterium]
MTTQHSKKESYFQGIPEIWRLDLANGEISIEEAQRRFNCLEGGETVTFPETEVLSKPELSSNENTDVSAESSIPHVHPSATQLSEDAEISNPTPPNRLTENRSRVEKQAVVADRSQYHINMPAIAPEALLTVWKTELVHVEKSQSPSKVQPSEDSFVPPTNIEPELSVISESQVAKKSVKFYNGKGIMVPVFTAIGLTLAVLSFWAMGIFSDDVDLKSAEDTASSTLPSSNTGNGGGDGNKPPPGHQQSDFPTDPPSSHSELYAQLEVPTSVSSVDSDQENRTTRLNINNEVNGERLPLPDIEALNSQVERRGRNLHFAHVDSVAQNNDAEIYTLALTIPSRKSGKSSESSRKDVLQRYPDLYRPSGESVVLAIDEEYKVGVNDEVEVTRFHEDKTLVTQHIVRENGAINYHLVGEIQVVGRSTTKIATILQQKLERFLINHTVDVRVTRYNSKFVRASGEIRERIDRAYSGPGFHPLRRGRTTLSEFLLAIGDTTPAADRTAIELIHLTGDKEIVNLDKILRKETTDPIVQHGDAIRVPSRRGTRNFISVTGDVNKPGIYDWQEGATVSEALLRAGNPLQPPSLSSVTIVSSDGLRTPFEYKAFMERQDRKLDILLKPNDIIFIDSQTAPTAKIIGEVRTEGTYELNENSDTLMSFILDRANGLTENADTNRIEIFRRGAGRLVYDLKELMESPYSKHDLDLEDGDFIIVPSVTDRRNRIWVLGQVTNPGIHFLEGQEVRVLDALRLAGGQSEKANLENVRLKRGGLKSGEQVINVARALKTGNTADNPILQPNDVIYVPTSFGSTISDLASNILPLIQIATFTQILREGR